MNYEDCFRQHLEALHEEGRYRVFADLKRCRGAYPTADHFAEGGTRDVTVWCSNDYLGMSQRRAYRAVGRLPRRQGPICKARRCLSLVRELKQFLSSAQCASTWARFT